MIGNDFHKKEGPLLTLPGLGGGSASTLVRKPPSGPVDSGWPFDLDTASFSGKSPHYNFHSQVDSNTRGFFLKPDGTAFYVLSSDEKVRRHNMSAYDIDTCSYNSVSSALNSPSGTAYGLYFKSDGTKLFYADNEVMRAYTLSSAWDITSMSAASDSYDFSSNTSQNVYSFNFKPDGTKLYIVESNGSSGNAILEYNLSTAWDLSTLSYSQKNNSTWSGFSNGYLRGVSFKSDGTYCYVSNAGNTYLARWTLSTAWDITSAGTPSVTNKTYYGTTQTFDFPGCNIQWSSDGSKYYFIGKSDETITQHKPNSAWSIDGDAYDRVYVNSESGYTNFVHPKNKSNKLNSTQGKPEWNSDGTKIYHTTGTNIQSLNVGTAYDITTVTNSGSVTQSLANTSWGPKAFKFNSGGTRMLWVESANKEVKQYNFSTGFDLSTVSDANNDLDITSGGGPSSMQCATVSDDGKYIYIAKSSTIYQWTLGTAFDLSTASFTRSQSGYDTSNTHIHISPDGTQVLTCTSNSYNATFKSYTLSTAWDISSKTYAKTFDLMDVSSKLPPLIHTPGWFIGGGMWSFLPYYGNSAFNLDFS
tara:strand:- start:5705 stop:7459 length:1755 start_codon:yes stop_codon:yes gene_type:complete